MSKVISIPEYLPYRHKNISNAIANLQAARKLIAELPGGYPAYSLIEDSLCELMESLGGVTKYRVVRK